jgi:hypothetical protein
MISRRFGWLGALLLGSCIAAHPGAAQQPGIARIGRLLPADAREAWHGVISPDGRYFAYEAVHDHNREIWTLDLATGVPTRLTTGPATSRSYIAWSPDARHIAFVAGRREIRLATVTGDTDRLLYRRPTHGKFDTPNLDAVAWVSDSEVTFRDGQGALFASGYTPPPDPTWIVRLDGAAYPTGDSLPMSPAPVVAPGARWSAAYRRCCGGGHNSLWLVSTTGEQARCVAGPLHNWSGARIWSPDARVLYVAESDGIYAIALDGAPTPPRRVIGTPPHLWSISSTRDGRIAMTAMAPHDSVADLWIATPPLPTSDADTLGRCSDPPPEIARFVADARLGAHSIDELVTVPGERFSIFEISYGPAMDVYAQRLGVRYRDRIGWLYASPFANYDATTERDHGIAFGVTAGDHFLFSGHLDSVIARGSATAIERWREFLARQPETPTATLVRLAESGAGIARLVAINPQLDRTDIPPSRWLSLAAQGGPLTDTVITRPSIRDDGETLVAIARFPNVRLDPVLQSHIRQRIVALGPRIASNPHASEAALFDLASMEMQRTASPALAAMIVDHPVARRSPRILVLFAPARYLPPARQAIAARALLALHQLGLTRHDAVLSLIDQARADTLPADVLEAVVASLPPNADNQRVWQAVATLGVRYSRLQHEARLNLARSTATPDSVLLQLAQSLDPHRDPGLAAALLANPHVTTNHEILATLGPVLGRVLDQPPPAP